MDDGRRQLSNSEREALLAIEERLRQEDHALAEFLSRGVSRPLAALHGSPTERVLRRLSPGALLAIAVTLFIVSRAIDDLFTVTVAGFCAVAAFLRHTKAWTDGTTDRATDVGS